MLVRKPCTRRRLMLMRLASVSRLTDSGEATTLPCTCTFPASCCRVAGLAPMPGMTPAGFAAIAAPIVYVNELGRLALPWLSTATALIVWVDVTLNGEGNTAPLVAVGVEPSPVNRMVVPGAAWRMIV